MRKLRFHGNSPFTVAVIHGGPGAGGEMYPVAVELSTETGILEPFQTADSVIGQIEELKGILEVYGKLPMTLVGYSWGAWLVYLLASSHPSLVKKLILVSSGPFEPAYAARLTESRLSHLSREKKEKMNLLIAQLKAGTINDGGFARFGQLAEETDSYDRIREDPVPLVNEPQAAVFQKVWEEADELRESGKLCELGKLIQCEVVAVHGDYDPHPYEGVREPLSQILKDFRFILLPRCGHEPWLERHAKDEFFRILKKEVKE